MIRLQTLLLTIAALPFAAGSRNKTHPGDRAISTDLEGSSRPRARRSQVRLSSSSTCRTLSTPMGVVRVQAHGWPEARAGQPALKQASTHLRKETDSVQVRHDKQLSWLRIFEQALESSRERLTSVLDNWNHLLKTQHGRVALSQLVDVELLQSTVRFKGNYRMESSSYCIFKTEYAQ
ncbi:hypothetical protein MYU51_017423 [Penicillium brevicompactum]